MKDIASKKPKREGAKSAPSERTLMLAEVLRENLFAFVVREGMKALDVLLERDREALCGPAYVRDAAAGTTRWGSTHGKLVMGGQRVSVRRPRVRQDGHEVALPAWSQFADRDPLNERTLEQIALGVSTRGYRRSVEELPSELSSDGAGKSAVSERLVAMTQAQLDAWLARDLSKANIAVIMVDGIEVAGHTVVVALGISESGEKQPLGLWEGATENSTVCQNLLDNLIQRGLDPQRGYLFVIDGSKALRKAIRDTFGARVLVQRCQEHKRRNVLAQLPKKLHPSVNKVLHDAYRSPSKAIAKRRLTQLVARLDSDHPGAAASLREGLDETLALKDMKLPDALERTLSTTNPIENLNGSIRRVQRRVKRWRDGAMVRRWAALGILEAQKGFRKLRGHKGMSILVGALRERLGQDHVDAQEVAA
jgi:transposase-like protein